MKRIVLSLTLLAASLMANAQLKQGAIAIGGTGNFSYTEGTNKVGSTSTNAPKTNTFNIIPSIGCNVSENIAIGLGIGYAYNKQEELASGSSSLKNTTTNETFIINPFARYYFMYNDNGGFFGQLNAAIGIGSGRYEPGITSGGNSSYYIESTSFDLGLRPGLIYFISNSWSIEGTYGKLGYSSSIAKYTKNSTVNNIKRSTDYEDFGNTFNIGFDLTTFNLGVQYWIGRK
jgi:outer membrane protein